MKRDIRSYFVAVSIFTLLLTNTASVNAADSNNFIDINVEQFRPLQPCVDALMLDCIEDAGIEHSNGSKTSFVTKEVIDYSNRNANVSSSRGFIWSAAIESQSGPVENFEYGVFIRTKARFDVIGQIVSEPGISVTIRPQGKESKTDRYFVNLRTSWLQIFSVSGFATDYSLVTQAIPGGTSIKFSALPVTQYGVTAFSDARIMSDNAKGRPWREVTATTADRKIEANFQHFDAIPRKKAQWHAECASTGFPITFSNGFATPIIYAAGDLKSTRGTILGRAGDLVWLITAPHLTPENQIIRGNYEADVPAKWLNCAFPNNGITQAPRIEIQITDENEGPQIATTSAKIVDGALLVRAFGFHYSTPHFRVYNPAPSKIVFTCKKGLLTKKISAIQPVCPKGYKKIYFST